MVKSLIWVSGGSRGIGRALAATVPWDDVRIITISRTPPEDGEHFEADLSEPSTWSTVGAAFEKELTDFEGERIVFIQAAGMLDPIGFAGEVDSDAYATNVVLNSAAPQVLGHYFLAAVRDRRQSRHLVMLTSGAASSVYPGWAAYAAAKAGLDQWVRDVGAEQDIRGGAHVIGVAPGTVDTKMQAQLRDTTEDQFPKRQKFIDLHTEGKLTSPEEAARGIWSLVEQPPDNGSIVDLREVRN